MNDIENTNIFKKKIPSSASKSQSEYDLRSTNSSLSIKHMLSNKYKENDIKNISISNNESLNNLNKPNNQIDFLFNKREKFLIEKLNQMEQEKEKLSNTNQIVNDFLFELQKIIGVELPENLLENPENIDNEKLIIKLQKIYKNVYLKKNGKKSPSKIKENILPEKSTDITNNILENTNSSNLKLNLFIIEKLNPSELPYDYREKISFNISIANCEDNSAYSVKAYNYFDFFKDDTLIYTSKEEFPTNRNINFNVNFETELFFERKQYILIKILKSKTNQVHTLKCPISKLLKDKEGKYSFVFDKNTKETITINSKLLDKPRLRFEISANFTMDNPDKNSYCYMIKKDSKINSNKVKDLVGIYKSEVQKFPQFSNKIEFNVNGINCNDLCSSDLNSEIILFVYNDSAKKKLLDTHRTTVNKIMENPIIFINPYAKLELQLKLKKEYSFSEYLKKNLEMNLNLAIDFTVSNGNSNVSGSLHEFNEHKDNPYEKAIKYCAQIIEQYDRDKIYSCFGYGAILPNQIEVSHCFNLNLTDNPDINGMDEVLKCYNDAIRKVTFKDPTYFSHIIRKITDRVKEDEKQNKLIYNILLIMTDGKVDDYTDTVDAIVEASHYPISIIIVGIGPNKFENMNILDEKFYTLTDKKGRKPTRDIVNFIPYMKYENNRSLLAKEIFNEVPFQIVEYFSIKEISPDDYEKKYKN